MNKYLTIILVVLIGVIALFSVKYNKLNNKYELSIENKKDN